MFKITKGIDMLFPNLASIRLFFRYNLLMYLSSQYNNF